MRARPTALLWLIAAWFVPAAAYACPFCARQNEAGRTVYYIATGLMLALPLGFIGGAVWWIRAHVRAHANTGEES